MEDLENFTGAEDAIRIAAGIIGFGMGKLGRKMANNSITDLKHNFLGWAWGNNGPGVITRTLKKLCNVTSVSKILNLILNLSEKNSLNFFFFF